MDTSSHLYIQHRIQELEKVLHSLQSNQQKLLKVLENEDVEGLVELLQNEQILIDERLSNIYPITALDYAASLVSFSLFYRKELSLLSNLFDLVECPFVRTKLWDKLESQ